MLKYTLLGRARFSLKKKLWIRILVLIVERMHAIVSHFITRLAWALYAVFVHYNVY